MSSQTAWLTERFAEMMMTMTAMDMTEQSQLQDLRKTKMRKMKTRKKMADMMTC
jgi:hypothetical protein